MKTDEKILLWLLGALFAFAFLVGAGNLLSSQKNYGAAIQFFTAYSMTNSTSTCNTTTSTIILASSSARNVLYISSEATSAISICEGSSCSAGQGYQLNSSSSIFSQPATAPYVGPVSCIVNAGTSGSSTVGLMFNNQ